MSIRAWLRIIGAGLNANLATVEVADAAAFTGQVTGVAGILAATETADAATFIGTIRWVGTLATVEAVDAVAFLGGATWVGTLATVEAKDTAAMLGTTRWAATLATTEASDQAAFTGIAGALPEGVALAAVEAPDAGAFTGSTVAVVTLATREDPDSADIHAEIIAFGDLATTEAPDIAVMGEAPPSIQEAPGSILGSELRRVRELMNSNQRIRSLKYPMPRPRELINTYGQRRRESAGRRVRTLWGTKCTSAGILTHQTRARASVTRSILSTTCRLVM